MPSDHSLPMHEQTGSGSIADSFNSRRP